MLENLVIISVGERGSMCYAWRSEDRLETWLSPSIMWVLGIKRRSSGRQQESLPTEPFFKIHVRYPLHEIDFIWFNSELAIFKL